MEADRFLGLSRDLPVIDVRSPEEFRQGHIPGALNIPVFNNKERSEVGTLYHQKGRDTALLRGLMISLDKVEIYQRQIQRKVHGPDVLLYCWRGGMRSENMAALFEASGFQVSILTDGYKGYRRHIRNELSGKGKFYILGGYTGSSKTLLLRAISRLGGQVIDLERLAHHKGSVFGGLSGRAQPTNEQFENDFFATWYSMDHTLPIWLEDESRMIGKVTLPPPLVDQIFNGIVVRVSIPREMRVANLVREYAAYPPDKLEEAVLKIREKLGGERTRHTIQALRESRFEEAVSVLLNYYDNAYTHTLRNRPHIVPFIAGLDGRSSSGNARDLLALLKQSGFLI